MIEVIRAKLHGLRVTGADLHYHGSITLDPDHCAAVGIHPLEFVEVWNKATGARLSTYVIFGEAGSGCCVLNGAAARTCQTGDEVIIVAKTRMAPEGLYRHRPRVAIFGPGNAIERLLRYEVFESPARAFDFRVADGDADDGGA